MGSSVLDHEEGHVQAWKDDLEARRESVQPKAERTVFEGAEPAGFDGTFEHLVGEEFNVWVQEVGDEYDSSSPADLGCNPAAFEDGGVT